MPSAICRKELVKDISEILDEKVKYMRRSIFIDRIDDYTVAKDGTLTWGAGVTDTKAEALLQALTAIG